MGVTAGEGEFRLVSQSQEVTRGEVRLWVQGEADTEAPSRLTHLKLWKGWGDGCKGVN